MLLCNVGRLLGIRDGIGYVGMPMRLSVEEIPHDVEVDQAKWTEDEDSEVCT